MKLVSVAGESVAPGKGGSPSDTFDRSIATWQENGQEKTITVTYVRYFGKVLAERGIYDQEAEGVPVSHLVATLFLEKHPEVKETRHYINDTEAFVALFEGFSLTKWKERYPL
ncbi:hypothetical protein [Brevibacillus sp. Leaf182]|uniref:hypothetical protein n=1 Tax=Brevibacillus sp. Leaf182 TaxID=1736290 RepID=UPI0006F6A6B6|nr:hypothetical protein [Brevibacillus sp. Leaf182]RAT97867.1 hypothetical protein ASG16_009480 [Brevibacillus sp. Leaf182]